MFDDIIQRSIGRNYAEDRMQHQVASHAALHDYQPTQPSTSMLSSAAAIAPSADRLNGSSSR